MADETQKKAAVDAKISSLLPSNKKTETYSYNKKGHGHGGGYDGYGSGYPYGGYGGGSYDRDLLDDGYGASASKGSSWGGPARSSTSSTGEYYLRKFEYSVDQAVATAHIVSFKTMLRRVVRQTEQLFKTGYEYDLDEATNTVEVPAEVMRRQLASLEAMADDMFEAMNLKLSAEGTAQLKMTLAALMQEHVTEAGTGRAVAYPSVDL